MFYKESIQVYGELNKVPTNVLRQMDIRTTDEEKEVQMVLNRRLAASPIPVEQPKFMSSETDNMTIEKERELQAKIDARNEENRKRFQESIKETDEVGNPVKKFCEFCDSKGVKHKKNCTRVI
jgi:hypothetical protein